MTAKQYLQQAFRLDAKIDANIEELKQLRDLSIIVSSINLAGDNNKSNSASDRVGNTVVKIIDLEAEINANIDSFVDLKAEIRERIDSVPDDIYRIILQKRYLNFQKWEQIAVDLGFTFQWVHVLHKKALKYFEKYLTLDCN